MKDNEASVQVEDIDGDKVLITKEVGPPNEDGA